LTNRAQKPPALITKLRQLRVQALNVATRDDRAAFAAGARAASLLAELDGRRPEAHALTHLAAQVTAMPATVNLSSWLDREIDVLIQRASSPLI
jgi:Flp pilus assembly CpaE family ATPase